MEEAIKRGKKKKVKPHWTAQPRRRVSVGQIVAFLVGIPVMVGIFAFAVPKFANTATVRSDQDAHPTRVLVALRGDGLQSLNVLAREPGRIDRDDDLAVGGGNALSKVRSGYKLAASSPPLAAMALQVRPQCSISIPKMSLRSASSQARRSGGGRDGLRGLGGLEERQLALLLSSGHALMVRAEVRPKEDSGLVLQGVRVG